jgi:hypothetical protein
MKMELKATNVFKRNYDAFLRDDIVYIKNDKDWDEDYKTFISRNPYTHDVSILICTIPERQEMLRALIQDITQFAEMTKLKIEILTDSSINTTIGKKRNNLLSFANGKYSCFIDDDDKITPSYFKVIQDAINNGMDVDRAKASAEDWVEKNVKTKFEGIKDLIKKDLTDYTDNVARKVNTPKPSTPKPSTPKPSTPKPNNITDITGQSWESITPLSPDELKKLEKMYRQKCLGQSFFRAMRTFWKSVEDMMTKQTELMDSQLHLMQQLRDLLCLSLTLTWLTLSEQQLHK